MKRSIHSYWQIVAFALLASWALDPVASANFGGGTIGSNPMTQGDDGEETVQTRPMFFIEGPTEMLFEGAPFAYDGPGQAYGVETGCPGLTRLEFAPELNVRVNMDLLADPRVRVGFRVAPRGGVTRVRWELGEHHATVETLPINSSVVLPVTRLRRSGLLEEGLGFTAFHRVSGRNQHSISTDGTALIVRPN